LLGKGEEDLANEIKIVKTISNDINTTFALEKRTKILKKKGRVKRNPHITNIFEEDIKELGNSIAGHSLDIPQDLELSTNDISTKDFKGRNDKYWYFASLKQIAPNKKFQRCNI
jgi:hypothetical protein